MDELGFLPLVEEHTGGGKAQLGASLLQLVARELPGNLVVKWGGRSTGHIVVVLVHLVVLAAPLGEQAIEDVLGHEAVEPDAARTDRVGLLGHAPQVVAHAGEAPGTDTGPLVEAVVCARAGLEDDGALFGAPLAHGGFHPLHIEVEHGLQEVVFGIGLVHQPVDGARDEVALLLGLLAEHGGIFAQHIVVDTGENFTGAVAALDGPLVDVLVEGVVGTAEQAAVDDVHIGIVTGIGEGVATVFGSEVVGQAVQRVEVGKGASVGFGHGGQLFVEEEEGERFAILADEHVGPLHQFGPGDGLQVACAGEGFLGQLLVLG